MGAHALSANNENHPADEQVSVLEDLYASAKHDSIDAHDEHKNSNETKTVPLSE